MLKFLIVHELLNLNNFNLVTIGLHLIATINKPNNEDNHEFVNIDGIYWEMHVFISKSMASPNEIRLKSTSFQVILPYYQQIIILQEKGQKPYYQKVISFRNDGFFKF